jgi:hypothetical protein
LENGNLIHSRNEIADYFTQNFSSIFQSSNPHIPADLEGLIDSSIIEAENDLLFRIPKADEIKKVVSEMNSHKAPSPDGFPGLFSKKYWNTVGSQVIAAVQNFFREG